MDFKEKVLQLRILKMLKDDVELRNRVIMRHYDEFGEDYDSSMRDLEIEVNVMNKIIKKIEAMKF